MAAFGDNSNRSISIAVCILSLIIFFYFGTTHGQGVTPSLLCGSDLYDIETLKALPYWTISQRGICYNSWGDSSERCVINLAFCKSLPLNMTKSLPYVGATQQHLGSIGTEPLILGMKSEITDDNSGSQMIVTYADGNQVNCGTISVIMYLQCNPDAQWKLPISRTPSEIPVQPKVYLVSTNMSCLYSIYADYAGACIQSTPGLSLGSILIIIFLCLMVVYLVGGVIYNMVKGATGWELIPNYEMWRNFPNDVMTGCKFVFSTIICQGGAVVSSDGYEEI